MKISRKVIVLIFLIFILILLLSFIKYGGQEKQIYEQPKDVWEYSEQEICIEWKGTYDDESYGYTDEFNETKYENIECVTYKVETFKTKKLYS